MRLSYRSPDTKAGIKASLQVEGEHTGVDKGEYRRNWAGMIGDDAGEVAELGDDGVVHGREQGNLHLRGEVWVLDEARVHGGRAGAGRDRRSAGAGGEEGGGVRGARAVARSRRSGIEGGNHVVLLGLQGTGWPGC
ncbi:hypothetical protein [Microvirga rosea]|uniref:hypothetical protein n=1 Tax=Microvirga rosea TaxID=2715425 RepID=UPI001D0BCE8A|nr:hypothetical protein [Microvirga rosea]MCB8821921.1 hypothetical protein [Microvirga rosea]